MLADQKKNLSRFFKFGIGKSSGQLICERQLHLGGFICCLVIVILCLIRIIDNMQQQGDEKLFFYSKDPEAANKTLGKARPLNPSTLLPQEQPLPLLHSSEEHSEITGKFSYDVLLKLDEGSKSKRIVKPDKRAHYKTKMCPYGRECKKKFSCNFAHSEQQLRKPFKNRKNPCKLYQLGKCDLGAACNDYHGNMDLKKKNYKYQTELCKDFINGKCDKGRVCIYIHEMPEQIVREEAARVDEAQQEQVAVKSDKEDKEKQVEVQEKEASAPNSTKKLPKSQVVQIVQSKIGQQEIIEDGLTFTFSFN